MNEYIYTKSAVTRGTVLSSHSTTAEIAGQSHVSKLDNIAGMKIISLKSTLI